MKRLATLFFALAFLGTGPAAAQEFTTNWELSATAGTLPAFIGTNYGARGLAYGMVDDGSGTMVERVFVSTTEGGTKIQVHDASDGSLQGTLDLTGADAAGRGINDVGVSADGIIVACNEVNNVFLVAAGTTQDFECFRWDSLTDTPTRIIDYTPEDGNDDDRGDWLGSLISVVGSASDNTMTIWTAGARDSDNVYYFTTDDNGATFSETVTTSNDPSASSIEGVAPTGTGEADFYHNIAGALPVRYEADGDSVDVVAEGALSAFTVSTRYVQSDAMDRSFLVAFNWEGGGIGQRAELVDLSDGDDMALSYGRTPVLGTNANVQANGDVDVRVNDDGTLTLFVLATNNGIGSYTTTDAVLTDADDDLAVARLQLAAEPNPFADRATISFETAEAGPVRLTVYDALGRAVATLVDDVRPAGASSVTFDAAPLAAGAYLVRLETAGASATQLVTLTR